MTYKAGDPTGSGLSAREREREKAALTWGRCLRDRANGCFVTVVHLESKEQTEDDLEPVSMSDRSGNTCYPLIDPMW